MIEPHSSTGESNSSSNKKESKKQVPNNNHNQHDEGEDGYAGSVTSSMENPALNLPKVIINRVNALKNIQLKMVNMETKFYEELHHLECKYAAMYEPFFEQREKIVAGEYEPTAEEIKWPFEDIFSSANNELNESSNNKAVNNENLLANELEKKVSLSDAENKCEDENIKGIPGFWLQAFKNTDIIGEMIQDHDEPVLKFLRDVRIKMHSQKPYGYTIEFHFNDNDYFTNKVLTKTYDLAIDLNQDDKDPLSYDGPIIFKCVGCKINWTKGKDVTVKLVKKKQKHKGTGTIRVVTKEEKQDSFFNFFDTPTEDGLRPSYRHFLNPNLKQEEEIDEEMEQLCEADFELGHFFKEFMVPKSVLYYTGELVDEANSYDDEYDDDDDEDFDDNDDGDEENDSIRYEEGAAENNEEKTSNKNKNKNHSNQLVNRKK